MVSLTDFYFLYRFSQGCINQYMVSWLIFIFCTELWWMREPSLYWCCVSRNQISPWRESLPPPSVTSVNTPQNWLRPSSMSKPSLTKWSSILTRNSRWGIMENNTSCSCYTCSSIFWLNVIYLISETLYICKWICWHSFEKYIMDM